MGGCIKLGALEKNEAANPALKVWLSVNVSLLNVMSELNERRWVFTMLYLLIHFFAERESLTLIKRYNIII
ncbi:MAG: hypothetical protein ACOYO1_05640 [Bacteroidales bacterium]